MKVEITIIMKTHSLFKTALSLLFFTSATCPAAFEQVPELDLTSLQSSPTITLPEDEFFMFISPRTEEIYGPSFDTLPAERLLSVVEFLDAKSLLSLSETCSAFRDLVEDKFQKDFVRAARNAPDAPLDPIRLKKHFVATLKKEQNAFYTDIFVNPSNGWDEENQLCLEAVLPLSLLKNTPQVPLSKVLEALNATPTDAATLVRFSSAYKQAPTTIVLTAYELQRFHKQLNDFLAHNPECSVHLVLGDGPYTYFGPFSMPKKNIAEVRHLIVSDPRGTVTEIGESFLENTTPLETFNARFFPKLETIGMSFLALNSNLKTVDTRGFTALKNLGSFCLFGCPRLKHIEAQGFTDAEIIGISFLEKCFKLRPDSKEKIRAQLAARGIEWR
jgi:hypothetical protein